MPCSSIAATTWSLATVNRSSGPSSVCPGTETTASAPSTASVTPEPVYALPSTTATPSGNSAADADRANATTSWPRSTARSTKGRPVRPVAPKPVISISRLRFP